MVCADGRSLGDASGGIPGGGEVSGLAATEVVETPPAAMEKMDDDLGTAQVHNAGAVRSGGDGADWMLGTPSVVRSGQRAGIVSILIRRSEVIRGNMAVAHPKISPKKTETKLSSFPVLPMASEGGGARAAAAAVVGEQAKPRTGRPGGTAAA